MASADFVPLTTKHSFCEAYQAEWKLTHILKHKDKKFISPPFCPLPNLDIKFCLELWFMENYNHRRSDIKLGSIKFILVKLDGSNVPDSLNCKIGMEVKDSDGKLLKAWYSLDSHFVINMDSFYFDNHDFTFSHHSNKVAYFPSGTTMLECPLILKFCMEFYDGLKQSPANCLASRAVNFALKTSNTSEDIKNLVRSDDSSDVLIHVGSKMFLAHTAVLSHYSSVFKQEMAAKLQNEIVVLDDNLCDAFDDLLDYLYEGMFEYNSWSGLRYLYVSSAKYEVLDLKEKCAAAILSFLSVDKVSEILKLACDHEDLSLKEPAVIFAAEHLRDIICFEEYKELIMSHPLIGYEVTVNAFNSWKIFK